MNKRVVGFLVSSSAYVAWLLWLCWGAPIKVGIWGMGYSAALFGLLFFLMIFKPLKKS